MEFKEYNLTDKNGKSNCVIRSICKFYSLSYEIVEEDLNSIAKKINKKINDIEVFETYMKQLHVYPIECNKNIKVKDLKLGNGKYTVLCYDKKDYYHMVYIENGVLYDKSVESLELHVINVYKLNTLELYKTWFNNKSFFNNNNFVIDNIEFLWKIINFIGFNYEERAKCKIDGFTSKTKEEIIKIVQNYYDKHKIDINIKELIDNKNLVLIEKQKNYNTNLNIHSDGNSYYDEEKDKIIAEVILEHKIIDSLIIIHELSHNRNQPHGNRNLTSDLLTEAISYTNELIACDEMLDDKDKENWFKCYEKTIYQFADNLYNIYKIILTYKHQHDITEEAYNKEFEDNNYIETMNFFDKYINDKQSIYRNSYYILCVPLTIYMFTKYQKDNEFFKNIEEVNNSINTKSFRECLNIIGIKDKEDLIQKIKESNEEFIIYLDDTYNKNKIK